MSQAQTPTLQGFYAFINEQDPSIEINHKEWRTCATGQYMASIGHPLPSGYIDVESSDSNLSWLEDDHELCDLLDDAYYHDRLNTYGELQAYIAS